MIFLFLHNSFAFKVLMILLSYYSAGSQVQLTRVLTQIPEIHQPDDIFLFIVEIDNLEVLHDDGTTILSPFLQFRYKRITLTELFCIIDEFCKVFDAENAGKNIKFLLCLTHF